METRRASLIAGPIVGVDTGGTFTDLVYVTSRGRCVHKILSTPDDPSRAVLDGLRGILDGEGPDAGVRMVHGSTVATNAILERKGAPTALVTTAGFEDVLEIGRQDRTGLYDLECRRQPPLAPASMRFGVSGRMDCRGHELEPMDIGDLDSVARAVAESGAESVAVCLLFSFLDPSHERAVAEALSGLDLPVSLSHEILAEFREYERTSTTVVNAYVCPRMDSYLARLQQSVPGPLRVMQSNGGSISAATARAEPVRTILSGPAGGAVGALEAGRLAGFERLMAFDMGGTSTDVCLMDGRLPLTTESGIGGLPVRLPMIDIHTVGAGGGSIASLDAGGALSVGPESAGADPGPACYGRGGPVTVTDANLFLGRLAADHFLGGTMRLDPTRVAGPMADLARRAGMTPRAMAEGILAVADAGMERALRVISVERGFDPREFTLLSFGGAGGMHAASLARLLSMPRVLVPADPGLLSAMGMLQADVVKDYSLTVMRPLDDLDDATLDRAFAPLEKQAAQDLAEEGFADNVTLERSLDMRYQGQSFEIAVPLGPLDLDDPSVFKAAFEAGHERRYGHANPGKPVEAVNLRLRARAMPERPDPGPEAEPVEAMPEAARLDVRPVVFDGVEHATALLDRSRLLPGNSFHGPAVVTEYSSTIVIPPGCTARVDGRGNLILEFD